MISVMANSQNTIRLTANGKAATVELENNAACERLISLLREGPITLSMTENGGFEKIGQLPESLPTSDVRQTARPGDIMLYLGNILCVFYGSNTWAYTKLGTINDMTAAEIKELLSGNPTTVVLSLESETGIPEITATEAEKDEVFDLKGNPVVTKLLAPGIYVINGKKKIIQ